LTLLPSIITSGAALIAATFSLAVALATLRRNRRENEIGRLQQIALAVMPRRLDALEKIWRDLFELQSGKSKDQESLARLVSASMWAPPQLREALLALAADGKQSDQSFAGVRRLLLQAAGVEEIDSALEKLPPRMNRPRDK
jgi:hypothetical protein